MFESFLGRGSHPVVRKAGWQPGAGVNPVQVSFLTPAEQAFTEELRQVNPEELRAIDALALIQQWKDRLAKSGNARFSKENRK